MLNVKAGQPVIYRKPGWLPERGFVVLRKLRGEMGHPPEYLIEKKVKEGRQVLLAKESEISSPRLAPGSGGSRG